MVSFRSYDLSEVASFLRARDRFGPFSNMAPGYPVRVCGMEAGSSEALYQALRFPHLPDFQWEVVEQPVPILAKRLAYARVGQTRRDWDQVKVNAMRYAIRVKFGATQGALLDLLRATGDVPIVEVSHRDDFWGARPAGSRLVDRNVLGRLLMELRAELAEHPSGEPILVAPRFPGAALLGAELGPERIEPRSETSPSFD